MMHDHTELQAFELADEVAVLVYRVTVFPIPFWLKNTSAFSLQPK